MLGYSVGYDKLITDTQCTFVPKYTSSQLHKKSSASNDTDKESWVVTVLYSFPWNLTI